MASNKIFVLNNALFVNQENGPKFVLNEKENNLMLLQSFQEALNTVTTRNFAEFSAIAEKIYKLTFKRIRLELPSFREASKVVSTLKTTNCKKYLVSLPKEKLRLCFCNKALVADRIFDLFLTDLGMS